MACRCTRAHYHSCVVSRSSISTAAAVFLVALCSAAAQAHDLITAESAERYLDQITRQLKLIGSTASAPVRADANYNLGRLLDEIRDLLNRDLGVHGRVQGLATEYLVGELTHRGLPLRISPQMRRFPAQVHYYSEALKLDPDGARAADAMFAWLQGSFYDSFDADPLQPYSQTWPQLQSQISIAERLQRRAPNHAQIEEAKFILAVLYARASRSAPGTALTTEYAKRARGAIADFQARYPDSLRAAAMPLLIDILPQ